MFPREYDRNTVKEWAGTSQWRAWRADLARFKKWGYSGWGSEGFWALTVYRLQRSIRGQRPALVWMVPRVALALIKKMITIVTKISLEPEADIGPGLLILHTGPVRLHAGTKIAADCAIHHVVTIGAGSRPGAATIGDHVMIGCQACVLGPVKIGDGATVASQSLVVNDVPANTTAVGVPARIVTGFWRMEMDGTLDEPADGSSVAAQSDVPALRPAACSLVRGTEPLRAPEAQLESTNHEAIGRRIAELMNEQFGFRYVAGVHSLRDVLDSVTLLELVLTIEQDFQISINLEPLSRTDLESPESLARAFLGGSDRQTDGT